MSLLSNNAYLQTLAEIGVPIQLFIWIVFFILENQRNELTMNSFKAQKYILLEFYLRRTFLSSISILCSPSFKRIVL